MADVMIPRKRVLDYLKSDIAEQLKDEQAASEKYRDMAELAERLGMADISGKLRGIAGDEDRHHSILNEMQKQLK
jgi:rubrerythrin